MIKIRVQPIQRMGAFGHSSSQNPAVFSSPAARHGALPCIHPQPTVPDTSSTSFSSLYQLISGTWLPSTLQRISMESLMFTQMSVRFCLRRGISRAGEAAQRGGGENGKLIDQKNICVPGGLWVSDPC